MDAERLSAETERALLARAIDHRRQQYAVDRSPAMVLELRTVPSGAATAGAVTDAMRLVWWLAGPDHCGRPVTGRTFDAVTGLRFLTGLAAAPATFRGSFSGGRTVADVAAQLEADLACRLVVASVRVHRDARDAAAS